MYIPISNMTFICRLYICEIKNLIVMSNIVDQLNDFQKKLYQTRNECSFNI